MTAQEDLTPEEKAAFESLATHQIPPFSLEDQVVSALKNEGLIEKKKTMNQYIKYSLGIAASITLFIAGNYFGRNASLAVNIDPLNGYMMILKENASFQPGDPMEMFQEYEAWMTGLADKGVEITGQELQPTAWEVSAEGTKSLSAEAETRVTGYFIIQAESEKEALDVVKDNPHIKYGGTIELKAYMNR